MIKNAVLAVALTALCRGEPELDHAGFQGVIELEERLLPFELGGRITSISVVEGQRVEPGQELARLDDAIARFTRDAREAELAGARAELALLEAGSRPEDIRALSAEIAAARSSETHAQRNLQRIESLASRGVSSASDLDAARASWEQASARRRDLQHRLTRLRHGARDEEIAAARARVAAAEAAVHTAHEQAERHVLRADAAGLVLDVHFELHELATAGAPVVTIADPKRPYVDVFVPQGRIGEVRLGAPATVAVDAETHRFSGVVEYVGNRTEFTPRFLFSERERPNLVLRVRIRIDDPEGSLHEGVPAFAFVDRQEAS